ncbi:MAG: hypothetical protein ACYTGC_06120 [Planctomycetota bacterium]
MIALAAFLVVTVAVGRNLLQALFVAVPAGVLAALLWVAICAALDPWLAPPASFDRKWTAERDGPLRTSPSALTFVWGLAIAATLPGTLFGVLVVSQWSGSSSVPASEWGAGWFLLAFMILAAAVYAAGAAGALVLLTGTPLGRRFAVVFALVGASLVGLAGFAPAMRWGGDGAAGGLGLLAMAAGAALGWRWSRRLAGFGPLARRWTGRGLLIGVVLGAGATVALMSVGTLRWNDPGHFVSLCGAGAGVGAVGGALFGAWRDWASVTGRCLHCGYLLRGLVGNRCPECGEEI